MALTRADLHETKEQVKEISCRESSTAGENSSSSRNNRRDNTDNPPNPDDQYLKNITIDVPTFDECHDPQLFLDWTLQLDKYFTWYNFTEPRKIKFAVMKLTGQASQYWTNLENICASRLQRPIKTWDMMKDDLKGKYVPPSFSDCLMDK